MPKEINRMVADSISDILLTSDPVSSDNLRSDGKPKESIVFVGIDMSLLETYFEEFIAKKNNPKFLCIGMGKLRKDTSKPYSNII